MTDKWQFYSQTGVDGPEYGVRIRPGYTVVGFQLEDARQIVAWQNASIQPEGDILEKVKALYSLSYTGGQTMSARNSVYARRFIELSMSMPDLITEVERLRSEIEIDNKLLADRDRIYEVCQCPDHGKCTPYVIEQLKSIPEKDARIKELEADRIAYRNLGSKIEELETYIERLEVAFLEAKRCPTCNGAGKLIDVVISRKLGRVESERVCPLCERKWEEKAREALEQIKAGTGSGEANQMVLTAEQREALEAMTNLNTMIECPECHSWLAFTDIKQHMDVLRDFLGKAGGKDESRTT